MKYAIIDQTRGDWFETIFNTEAEAIATADYEWGVMAKSDKNRREAYFVASCEVDEYGCIDWDTVEPIKEYK